MSNLPILAWGLAAGVLALLTGRAAAALNSSLAGTGAHIGADGWMVQQQAAGQALFTPNPDPRFEQLRPKTLRLMEALLAVGIGGSPLAAILARAVGGSVSIGGIIVVSAIAVAAAAWASRPVRQARMTGVTTRSLLLQTTLALMVAFVGIVVALWT